MRPMSPKTPTSLRLDPGLARELDDLASRLGWSRSQVVEVLCRIGLRAVARTGRRAEDLLGLAAGPEPEKPTTRPRKPRDRKD